MKNYQLGLLGSFIIFYAIQVGFFYMLNDIVALLNPDISVSKYTIYIFPLFQCSLLAVRRIGIKFIER
jgi:hypothetical protein